MKKLSFSMIFVFIFICCSNKNQNTAVNSNQHSEPEKTTQPAQVIVVKTVIGISELLLFKPINLNIRLKSKRPSFCEHNFLSVAAAFTSKTNTIDGIFIQKGQYIGKTKLDVLTGTCILSEVSLVILKTNLVSDSLISEVIKNQQSLFQQILLVNNYKLIECSLFGKTEFVRRALIEFNNAFCICQSKKALTIQDFQKALVDVGVKNALYLDMGGWSEGWYKNTNDEKIVIGEGMKSTHRQTNWLVYEVIN